MARELRFRELLAAEPDADKRTKLDADHKAAFERIKSIHGHHPVRAWPRAAVLSCTHTHTHTHTLSLSLLFLYSLSCIVGVRCC